MNGLPFVVGIAAAVGAYLLTLGIIASRAADATALARERLARQEVGLGQSAVALQRVERSVRADEPWADDCYRNAFAVQLRP